jgi:uncharacterized RDD family membrane protein YckC
MKKVVFWKRLLAMFIDGLPFGGFAFHDSTLLALFIVYETVLISQWNGQTIGKRILGIKVVTTSGGKLDWLKAFIRSLSKLLSAMPLFLGYFWMLWDEKSQTWHDKIADTFVVEA